MASPVPSLRPFVDVLRQELDQIESVFYAAHTLSSVDQYQLLYAPAEDGCLISLWDAWNRFMRSILLACASGPIEGLSGAVHSPAAARSAADAVAHIRAHVRGTNIRLVRGEPAWYSLAAVSDFVSVLGLGNGATIVGAVTSTYVTFGPFSLRNPLEEIRVFRNFVAHKCDTTLADIRAYTVAGLSDLRQHIRFKRQGVELFSDWKEGCLAIAEASAQ